MSTNNKNVGKALTLEQLRKMNDQPVKVKNLEFDYGGICTGVVTMSDPNESENGVDVGCSFYCIKDYGKTWIAYSYQPVNIDLDCGKDTNVPTTECKIDRDEWTAEWKRGKYPSGTHYLYCSKCGEISGKHSMFCQSCGRAMTPEAWDELEKRLLR